MVIPVNQEDSNLPATVREFKAPYTMMVKGIVACPLRIPSHAFLGVVKVKILLRETGKDNLMSVLSDFNLRPAMALISLWMESNS